MRGSCSVKLEVYIKDNGEVPFIKWLDSLKDKDSRYRIKVRLDRISKGNLGDSKSIGGGVYEFKMLFGAGFRIYYGVASKTVVLLLCAGNKSTQKADIKLAKKYWSEYLNN